MLRPSFDIASPEWNADQQGDYYLVIEVSDRLFSYVLLDAEKKQIYCLRQYNFDWLHKTTLSEQIDSIIDNDPYLQGSIKDVIVVYNYEESNLVPEGYFNLGLNKTLTELVYGKAKKGLVISEKINNWSLYNVYRIPREVHTKMQQRFSAGKYWHYYSLLLTATPPPGNDAPVCTIIFYADRFICFIANGGKLQLVQTWMYQTPEDVAYYLLSVCSRFQYDQETINIRVGGLIDEQSALYTELMKYFLLVTPVAVPVSMEENKLLSAFPRHYFSPLLTIATCV
jgi:hypothetical protein